MNNRKELYLDDAATTIVKPEVIKEMIPYFNEIYGNPSSQHKMGEDSLKAIGKSRKIIANSICANPSEIIFTSGATESNNLAIQGLSRAYPKKRKIVISSIEHPSVNGVCYFLNKKGYTILRIGVDKEGKLKFNELEKKIDNDVLLVSIIHVNNVIGTIQDIDKIGKMCKKKKVFFHTDASQSFMKIKINVKKMNIDLLSASAHKINGPKGIGFLYVNQIVKMEPLIFGGGQEKLLRSGTENVPGIVGFAKAVEIYPKKSDNIKIIRDKLMIRLEKIGGIINGSKKERIFNNIHVSFPDVDADLLVSYLSQSGIYVSIGSACESKKKREDHVLKSIGLPNNLINSSIRITLNSNINEDDVLYISKKIAEIIKILKNNGASGIRTQPPPPHDGILTKLDQCPAIF